MACEGGFRVAETEIDVVAVSRLSLTRKYARRQNGREIFISVGGRCELQEKFATIFGVYTKIKSITSF